MNKNKTLLDLTGEFFELYDFLSDSGGDVTDEAKEAEIDAVLKRLAESEGEIKAKLDGYISVIAELEARAEIRKAEANRLLASSAQSSADADKLKSRLQWAMRHVFGKDQLETNFHSLKISKVGGKRSLVLDARAGEEDFVNLPEIQKFTKIIPPVPEKKVIDNEAVRAALEAGEELNFAKLAERKEVLKIK